MVAPRYMFARRFSDGLAAVLQRDGCGFVDTTGREVISLRFKYCSDFDSGAAPVGVGGRWGLIDRTGAYLLRPEYDQVRQVSGAFPPKRKKDAATFVVMKGTRLGLVDHTGRTLIALDKQRVGYMQEGVAWIQRGGRTWFVDRSGRTVFDLSRYKPTHIRGFSEGLVAAYVLVNKRGKRRRWAFFDKRGTMVIGARFAYTAEFSDGRAAVSPNGSDWGYIDRKGTLVIPYGKGDSAAFSEGLAATRPPGKRPSKYGFMDTSGRVVIPFRYDSVTPFRGGLAKVTFDSCAPYGKCKPGQRRIVTEAYIDRRGNTVWGPRVSGKGPPASRRR